ncbi:MAG: hypothetical protein CMK07_03505 [Ponticaulis sp.]|nr:hypothetical protein [Ponticaulis sp.]
MFREHSLPIVYGGLVFLLSACATAANGGMAEREQTRGIAQFAEDPRLGEEVSRMCFTSSIDSFSTTTRDTVVLEVSPSRHYIVETSSCSNLDSAQSLAIDGMSSCATRGDALIVSDSAFGLKNSSGLGPDRCLIKRIHEWNEDAAVDMAEK